MSLSTDRNSTGSEMNASHTESGYLTDSVMSGKDTDSLTCTESQTSASDITPSGENLMTFSESSSSTSLLSPDGDVTVREQLSECKTESDSQEQNLDKPHTESDRITQLQSLASLDLNDASKEMSAIDDIFATNFASSPNGNIPLQNQNVWNDTSVSNSRTIEADKSERTERKRSKSSAFPMARQKEGVNITEELLSKSLPHGKVVRRDTGLIEFIADDLQEKIRRSSPMSKTGQKYTFCF